MAIINGDDDDNTLTGTAGDDEIYGNGGNDTLDGGEGNDSVYGGVGNDEIFADLGGGTAIGGEGQDTLQASGYHLTEGVEFNAAVEGVISDGMAGLTHSGFEVFWIGGTQFDDTIVGGEGNDNLDGNGGNDSVDGGAGNDGIFANLGGGTAIGGDGQDTLQVSGYYLTEGVEFNAAVEEVISGGVAGLTQSGFEVFRIVGTNFDDTIVGGDSNDSLYGAGGNDYLNGSDGNDTLAGAGGDDCLKGGGGNDFVIADLNDDMAIGGSGQDTLRASEGFDNLLTGIVFNAVTGVVTWLDGWGLIHSGFEVFSITGTAFGDTIVGGYGGDSLDGGDGSDVLDGGDGSDILDGGVGNDDVSTGDMDGDEAVGGLGRDTLHADGSNLWTGIVFDASSTSVALFDDTMLTHTGFEVFDIRGTGYDDTLIGRGGNDSLDGGVGNDIVKGGAGNDRLNGGAGLKAVWKDGYIGYHGYYYPGYYEDVYTTSADTLSGGLGNDLYIVDNIGDVVTETSTLAAEIDTVQSLVSRTLGANLENLRLTGTAISGTGNALANILNGNDVANTLRGAAGKDILTGAGGSDTLSGFSGVAANGVKEIDTLSGGTGKDRFDLGNATMRYYDDALTGKAGRSGYALITDFTVGQDKLQLKGSASDYYLGASGVAGVAGSGLFHEQGATDELIAIVRSANATALTDTNTIKTAVFV